MTDDTPDVPDWDADPDEWDDYWDESTTITVDRWQKAFLDECRDGTPWGTHLVNLQREHNDPLTLTDVNDIAEQLVSQLEPIAVGDEAIESNATDRLMDRLDELERTLKHTIEAETRGPV